MNKVTIKYVSKKVGHSRHGYTRCFEQAVRFVEDDGLDEAIRQFKQDHEVTEIKISKI